MFGHRFDSGHLHQSGKGKSDLPSPLFFSQKALPGLQSGSRQRLLLPVEHPLMYHYGLFLGMPQSSALIYPGKRQQGFDFKSTHIS